MWQNSFVRYRTGTLDETDKCQFQCSYARQSVGGMPNGLINSVTRHRLATVAMDLSGASGVPVVVARSPALRRVGVTRPT